MLPFTDELQNLDEYITPDPLPTWLTDKGKQWLETKSFNHDWGWNQVNSVQEKHERLKDMLRYCPVSVSVCGWKESNGIYYKDEGDQDNHWTCVANYDGDNPIIFDSYPPFIKKLEANYNFGYSKRYVLDKKPIELKKNESYLKRLFGFWCKEIFA